MKFLVGVLCLSLAGCVDTSRSDRLEYEKRLAIAVEDNQRSLANPVVVGVLGNGQSLYSARIIDLRLSAVYLGGIQTTYHTVYWIKDTPSSEQPVTTNAVVSCGKSTCVETSTLMQGNGKDEGASLEKASR